MFQIILPNFHCLTPNSDQSFPLKMPNETESLHYQCKISLSCLRCYCCLKLISAMTFESRMKKIVQHMPKTLSCILVFGAKTLHGTKGQKVSPYAALAAKNYASDLTAKISTLCIFPHCVPIRPFTRGCGGEPQHLSFLWTYVKDFSYCQILEGSCSLLSFPPN